MQIDIKNLEFIDQTLRDIVTDLERRSGFSLTVTSLYRIGDGGVHGQLPLRGIDFRMRNQTIGEAVESVVNDKWIYDPARPSMRCAVLHDSGEGLHLHVQSHPRTQKR